MGQACSGVGLWLAPSTGAVGGLLKPENTSMAPQSMQVPVGRGWRGTRREDWCMVAAQEQGLEDMEDRPRSQACLLWSQLKGASPVRASRPSAWRCRQRGAQIRVCNEA